MKLSPVSFNLNKQVRNNKTQNQPRLRPMASDSISFSAKIPVNLQAELKYLKLLQEDEEGEMTYLAESEDPEVLELLNEMSTDKNVSDKFKIDLLTRQDGKPFERRVQLGRENSDYHSKVALAMLELMPEKDRHRILSFDALGKASVDMTRVLLSSDQRLQLFGTFDPGYRPKDREPFVTADNEKRKAILACCDERLQRKLLLDPYLVHSRSLHEILAVAPDEQIKKDIFQVLKKGRNNILHEVGSKKLEYYLNVCNLKKYPDVLAKLLLQENELGYIPIETVEPEAAQMMFDSMPNEETLNAMLTRKRGGATVANTCEDKTVRVIIANAPSDEIRKMLLTTKPELWKGLPIARLDLKDKKALIELSPDDETKKIQLTNRNVNDELPIDKDDPLWFLTQSPDDETLMLQLDERRTWERHEGCYAKKVTGPIRSRLSFDDYFEVFDMMKDVSSIKQTLLSEWKERKSFEKKDYTNNTASVITKDIVSGKNSKQQEKLFNLLIKVIEDDSTTTDEAIKLIRRYKKYMSEANKDYLTQLERYFKS